MVKTLFDSEEFTQVSKETEMSRVARRKKKKSLLEYIFNTKEVNRLLFGVFLKVVDRQLEKEAGKGTNEKKEKKTEKTISNLTFIYGIFAAFFILLLGFAVYLIAAH